MTSDWNGLAEACSSAADNIEKNMEPVRFHPPMVLLRRAAAALAHAAEMEKALEWIGRNATREDFEKRWNTVQDIACAALAGIKLGRVDG